MKRIWNERQDIGAASVIKTLGEHGISATQGEAEFVGHEGVYVAEADERSAVRLVLLYHGRK